MAGTGTNPIRGRLAGQAACAARLLVNATAAAVAGVSLAAATLQKGLYGTVVVQPAREAVAALDRHCCWMVCWKGMDFSRTSHCTLMPVPDDRVVDWGCAYGGCS